MAPRRGCAQRLEPAIGRSDFGYDWAKRLVSVNLPDTFSTAVPTCAWRLDVPIASRTWGTGTTATFTYDAAKRPAECQMLDPRALAGEALGVA